MNLWLGILAGMLVIAAGVLIISASLGVALGISFEVAVACGIVLLVVAAILAYLFHAGIKAQYKKVKTGEEALIGATGIATTDLTPKGEVRVLGEFWQAISKDTNIPNGAPVEVVCLEGMFLVVKPAEEKLNSSKCQ
jgi:membrane-bound serine protease (ClpP class)